MNKGAYTPGETMYINAAVEVKSRILSFDLVLLERGRAGTLRYKQKKETTDETLCT